MKYIISRDNLSVAIFVPFDCNNNCPFCASKSMYNGIKKDPEKIYKDIELLNNCDYVKSYVITGGEPFANLKVTSRMVELMNPDKNIFINTSLPNIKGINEVIEFINSEPKVNSISISRHIGVELNNVAPFSVIKKINKPIRINTVINDEFTFDKFDEFVDKYGSETRIINLRADYRKETFDSLKSQDKAELELLKRYQYIGNNGSLASYSLLFKNKNGIYINYHRGMTYSSITTGNYCYVNDIIITPDGNIYKDWDYSNDNEFIKFITETKSKDYDDLSKFGLNNLYLNLDI